MPTTSDHLDTLRAWRATLPPVPCGGASPCVPCRRALALEAAIAALEAASKTPEDSTDDHLHAP